MSNRYTPETGYPTFGKGGQGPEDDVYVFIRDGVTFEKTGDEVNEAMDAYFRSERYQEVLRRNEAGEPPLFSITENEQGEPEVFLGDSDLVVTDVSEIEASLAHMFRNIGRNPIYRAEDRNS